MVVDAGDGCSAVFPMHPDGLYEFNEEMLAVQFAWQTACGAHPPGQCPNKAIERMWQRWQARREHPIYSFGGHPLLSEWSAYVVQLPFYMSHAFNADPVYGGLFESHWRAERALYNGSVSRPLLTRLSPPLWPLSSAFARVRSV